MKISQTEFIRICNDHGVLATDDSLRDVLRALKAFESSKKNATKTFTGTNELIDAYFLAIEKVHGRKATFLPEDARRASAVVKALGLERAIELVRVYVQMKTPWFRTKAYDFMTFYNSLGVIQEQLDTGRTVNRVQLREDERNEASVDAVREYVRDKYNDQG